MTQEERKLALEVQELRTELRKYINTFEDFKDANDRDSFARRYCDEAAALLEGAMNAMEQIRC